MSLTTRALIAIVLMVGFYALALGIAGGLLWLVWIDIADGSPHVRLLLFGGGLAAMILWSIFPRPMRYEAPGPRLTAEEQPELFDVLEGVAREAGQEMPADVYLTRDVNAGVLQVGGFAGFGSRRVMEVGLPLMQALTVPQFRAVMAHEFGHYDGGDTKLSPLIYRTRLAIDRVIETLAGDDGVTHKPFLWYGKLFMRVTQPISRAQELAADRLAARIAGAKNAGDALIAVERAGVAYQAYWQNEVLPVLSHGYHPPLAAGFNHFVAVDSIQKAVEGIIEESLATPEKSAYDSHPPLRERLDALATIPLREATETAECASTLLRDLARLEEGLVRASVADWFAATLKPVKWEEAGTTVFLPQWREHTTKHADVLRGVTAAELPRVAKALPDFSLRLRLAEEDGEQTAAAEVILGTALAVQLHDQGWLCDAMPGRPIAFTRDGKTIEPFTLVPKLRAGDVPAGEWEATCENAGIARMPLA
jgi:Zn-dependent protease with chaperone function